MELGIRQLPLVNVSFPHWGKSLSGLLPDFTAGKNLEANAAPEEGLAQRSTSNPRLLGKTQKLPAIEH